MKLSFRLHACRHTAVTTSSKRGGERFREVGGTAKKERVKEERTHKNRETGEQT